RRLISSTERDISDVSARMSAITLEKVTAAAESRAAEASLEQRMNEAEARRVQFVLSPVAGRVAALPVAAGQPVSPGGTVAVVIPEGARLEAELLAPSSAAGFNWQGSWCSPFSCTWCSCSRFFQACGTGWRRRSW